MAFDKSKNLWKIRLRGWLGFQYTDFSDPDNAPKEFVETMVLLSYDIAETPAEKPSVAHVDPINHKAIKVRSVYKPTRTLLEGATYHRYPAILSDYQLKNNK